MDASQIPIGEGGLNVAFVRLHFLVLVFLRSLCLFLGRVHGQDWRFGRIAHPD